MYQLVNIMFNRTYCQSVWSYVENDYMIMREVVDTADNHILTCGIRLLWG